MLINENKVKIYPEALSQILLNLSPINCQYSNNFYKFKNNDLSTIYLIFHDHYIASVFTKGVSLMLCLFQQNNSKSITKKITQKFKKFQ